MKKGTTTMVQSAAVGTTVSKKKSVSSKSRESAQKAKRVKNPESVQDLYFALCESYSGRGKLSTFTQPWPEYDFSEGWKSALIRFQHFLVAMGDRVQRVPINNNISNDGATGINTDPGRPLIERWANVLDTCIERAILERKAQGLEVPRFTSPKHAIEFLFGITPESLDTMTDTELRAFAKSFGYMTVFSRNNPEDKVNDSIIDIRDYGTGIRKEDMPNTILSLNRGYKKGRPEFIGNFGQGGSGTFSFSALTVIATRRMDQDEIAFTVVEEVVIKDDDGFPVTTYAYFTVDGEIPYVNASEVSEFEHGTLVRQIGYDRTYDGNMGDRSFYGLTNRLMPDTSVPMWSTRNAASETTKDGKTVDCFYPHGHLTLGAANAQRKARYHTLNGYSTKKAQKMAKVVHSQSRTIVLPSYEVGGQKVDPGVVKFTYFVNDRDAANGKRRSPNDAIKNFVDPRHPIALTYHGQNHGEIERSIITSQEGAKLWAVGPYMTGFLDASGMHPRCAKLLFSSGREFLKDTPLKKRLLDEVKDTLERDETLNTLNTQWANSPRPKQDNFREDLAAVLARYLKDTAGMNLKTFISRRRAVEEKTKDKPKEEPIPAQDPGTFFRWLREEPTVTFYPGQKYSFRFETNCPVDLWDPGNQDRIKVTSNGPLKFRGAHPIRGGRARCFFECDGDAKVGQTATICALVEFAPGSPQAFVLNVLVVEKGKPKNSSSGSGSKNPGGVGSGGKGNGSGAGGKGDLIEVAQSVLFPEPLNREKNRNIWDLLGWQDDPTLCGLSIRKQNGAYGVFYNAEEPALLEHQRFMEKRGLLDEFNRALQMKIVMHTCITINEDILDEDGMSDVDRKRFQTDRNAMLQVLALAARTECLLNQNLNREKAQNKAL